MAHFVKTDDFEYHMHWLHPSRQFFQCHNINTPVYSSLRREVADSRTKEPHVSNLVAASQV